MDLSTAQQILVVVLATALAIFLVLSIVIAILIIRLVKTLQGVAERAEHLVASAEAVGDVIKNAAGPVTVLRFVRSMVDLVATHKKASEHKE